MATPPPGLVPAESMQAPERVQHWVDAGLIDAEQGRRIREFELSHSGVAPVVRGASEARAVGSRVTGTELLAYLGVLIALAGVLTLVYSSPAPLGLIGALTLVLGLLALGMWAFARRHSAPAARAAGAASRWGQSASVLRWASWPRLRRC